MPFALRSFQDVLELFRATDPTKKPKSYPNVHYAAYEAWSFKSLKSWPRDPPVNMLARMPDPGAYDEDVMLTAKALVEYANFGNAIGTWNARGEASRARGEGWILAAVNLTQEQADEDGEDAPGNYVSLILAVWRLSDGWAAAVLRDTEHELAARLIGLDAWPAEGWVNEEVWFGE